MSLVNDGTGSKLERIGALDAGGELAENLGYHDQPELADEYRKVGELKRENDKLRRMLEAVMPSEDFRAFLKSLF